MTKTYQGVICRGCYALGTACGRCEKCEDERKQFMAAGKPDPKKPWPSPSSEMLETPEFSAVWECIKDWDINVPGAYSGYCGATGNHVRAILDALAAAR